jgi:hypothetical protein
MKEIPTSEISDEQALENYKLGVRVLRRIKTTSYGAAATGAAIYVALAAEAITGKFDIPSSELFAAFGAITMPSGFAGGLVADICEKGTQGYVDTVQRKLDIIN